MGAAALAASPGAAQQEGGVTAGLTLTPGVHYEDERFSPRLGFGAEVRTQTRTQNLALSFNTALDGTDLSSDLSDSLRDPRLNLSYSLENRNTAFETTMSYRRSKISRLFLAEVFDEEFLVLDEGQRSDLNTTAALTFGREAPFGGVLDLRYGQIRYSGTSDPGLRNEDSRAAGLSLRFDVDRRIRMTLAARISETDVAGDGTDQRRESLSLGTELAVSPTLSTSLRIGTSRITETTGGTEQVRDGVTWGLTAEQELPNGSLSGQIDSDLTAAGRLSTARLDREMDLPRGTLRFGGGVSQQDGGKLTPIASLRWQHAIPTASFQMSYDRSLRVTRAGESGIDNQLGLSWQQEIDPLSQLGLSMTLRQTERLDAGASDTQQASLSLSWQRDLTQDWALRASYTHRWTRDAGSRDTRENNLFLGLERSFQWRP